MASNRVDEAGALRARPAQSSGGQGLGPDAAEHRVRPPRHKSFSSAALGARDISSNNLATTVPGEDIEGGTIDFWYWYVEHEFADYWSFL